MHSGRTTVTDGECTHEHKNKLSADVQTLLCHDPDFGISSDTNAFWGLVVYYYILGGVQVRFLAEPGFYHFHAMMEVATVYALAGMYAPYGMAYHTCGPDPGWRLVQTCGKA